MVRVELHRFISRANGLALGRWRIPYGQRRWLWGNRESNRRPPPQPPTFSAQMAPHGLHTIKVWGRWWLCGWRRTAVATGATRHFLVHALVAERQPIRPRAGPENTHGHHRPNARSPYEKPPKTKLKPKKQDASKPCTARPLARAPSVVPRETPTQLPAKPPSRPRAACPSSPSTQRPASGQTQTTR